MEQLALFAPAGQTKGLPEHLLDYRAGLIPAVESDRLLKHFIDTVPWKQTTQKLWKKTYQTPRLTCWFGHTDRIAGTLPWTDELLTVRALVEPLSGIRFNSVLLNYYRDGNDSVAWHSDKESIMGSQPVIASVSFGEVRSFDIRNKADHNEKYSVRLEHGSFLLMKSGLQESWEHRIAKSVKPMKPRINLTFRMVI
ncbi:alpha-ketoglutarate-dependent dioxygenase AlkB [Mucilaginibacter conchicola]|uniref:Alpha-ketoglutarate-dependent dioxygenase AlkB n=1 Tax=Mucilaginibacter conchicola TaxID=2303333 RepID=A0A372NQM8_9SPHI|nr:alpha-ketoglutarate-dependent dioxygenase AlkB [Mucilaginibacter conchicola]RFZ91212.1 alpha-ketoglutarate-dependent dioxygenase AlkB [Mucilaginibacter conchicola]